MSGGGTEATGRFAGRALVDDALSGVSLATPGVIGILDKPGVLRQRFHVGAEYVSRGDEGGRGQRKENCRRDTSTRDRSSRHPCSCQRGGGQDQGHPRPIQAL